MNVTVLSWMRNEEELLPFFLRHYSFADRIVVWDNESTDRTRRILEADPRVDIRDWVTGGETREDELRRMKSEEYRKVGPGWKFVVDADEFVAHINMRAYLEACESYGVTMPKTRGYDMVSDFMPKDDGQNHLTDAVREGVRNPKYDKFCVLGDGVEVEYYYGAHAVSSVSGKSCSTNVADLVLLHYRYVSLDRTERKAREYVQSASGRSMGLGTENCDVALQLEKWHDAWKRKERVL